METVTFSSPTSTTDKQLEQPNFTNVSASIGFTSNSNSSSLEHLLITFFIALDGSICLLTVPLSVLNLLVILHTSVLHRNLKMVILSESSMIFLRALFRIAWILQNIIEMSPLTLFPTVPYVGYCLSSGFRNFTGHILIVERILATYFVKSYEKHKSPHFTILWATLSSVFTFISIPSCINVPKMLNVAILNGPQSSENLQRQKTLAKTLLPTVVQNFVLVVLSGFEIVIFYKLLGYNKEKYEEGKGQNFQQMPRNTREHSLSERYQLSENIRTGRQLLPIIILHLLNMLNMFAGFSVMFFQLVDLYLFDTVIASIQLIISSSISCAIEVIIITSHPILCRRVSKWFQIACSVLLRRQANVTDTNGVNEHSPSAVFGRQEENGPWRTKLQLATLNGSPMVVTPRAQADEHFQMLRQMWGGSSCVDPFPGTNNGGGLVSERTTSLGSVGARMHLASTTEELSDNS